MGDWHRRCDRFDKIHNGVIRLFHDRAIWLPILTMLDANPDALYNRPLQPRY